MIPDPPISPSPSLPVPESSPPRDVVGAIEAILFGPPEPDADLFAAISGVFRVPSITTQMLILRTANEWWTRKPEDPWRDKEFATLAWLYLLCAPEAEVYREAYTAYTPESYQLAVLQWGARCDAKGEPFLKPSHLPRAQALLEIVLRHEAASDFDVAGTSDPDAPPNASCH